MPSSMRLTDLPTETVYPQHSYFSHALVMYSYAETLKWIHYRVPNALHMRIQGYMKRIVADGVAGHIYAE